MSSCGHRDAEPLEHVAGTDTGELEDLRRADSAGAQDHLATRSERAASAALLEHQAGDAFAVERQPFDQRLRFDDQVAAMFDGTQKGLGRVPAHARPLIDVKVAATLVVAAIEIFHLGDARLRRGGAEGVEDLPADARQLHPPLAAARMDALESARSERVRIKRPLVLVLFEVGQHVLPGPAGIAHLPPRVVVARLPAHIDHAIDGGAAAEHAAARVGKAATVEPGSAAVR